MVQSSELAETSEEKPVEIGDIISCLGVFDWCWGLIAAGFCLRVGPFCGWRDPAGRSCAVLFPWRLVRRWGECGSDDSPGPG